MSKPICLLNGMRMSASGYHHFFPIAHFAIQAIAGGDRVKGQRGQLVDAGPAQLCKFVKVRGHLRMEGRNGLDPEKVEPVAIFYDNIPSRPLEVRM